MAVSLIDGDGILYRCGFAVEKTKYLVESPDGSHYFDTAKDCEAFLDASYPEGAERPPRWQRKDLEPFENAITLVEGVMRKIRDATGSEAYELYLTPSVGNFRDYIASRAKYKGNREFTARPSYYERLRRYFLDNGAVEASGQEADDEIGIRATELKEWVIVSYDKDLRQVSGPHYNWVTGEMSVVSYPESRRLFWTQVLAGDPVDNVPGLPKVGPATAYKMLEGVKGDKGAWEVCVRAYESHFGGGGYELALETARLVHVRRHRDEIWNPPT